MFVRSSDQSGAILIEAALAFVMLVILLIGLVDVGQMVHAHIVLTDATKEGARLGARIRNLADDPHGFGHAEIQARAVGLMSGHKTLTGLANVTFTSDCVRGAGNAPRQQISGDQVIVDVSAQYNGFFPAFQNVVLRSRHVAAYLSNPSCYQSPRDNGYGESDNYVD